MAIIKCLLTIVLLFVIILSLTLQDSKAVNIKVTKNPYRLPKHVAPLHYDIKLIPYISENEEIFTFDGEASIVLEVREPTYTIILHSFELTINESMTKLGIHKRVNQIFMCCEPIPFLVEQHEYNSDTQMLTIHFEERLYPNKFYQLDLKFTGSNEGMFGFYRTFYIDNEGRKIWLAATYFHPIYARKAFPCWDEPAIKAIFNISIKHYPNYSALSNMPSTRSEVDPIDGKLWTYFKETPIMSTNILGFVIADYNYVTIEDGTTKVWGPKHLQHTMYALNVAKQATRELEKFTNSTIHTPKMDHVAVPRYPVYGFESWGMITYEQNVLFGEKSLTDKLDNIITIVHELTNQWFNNLVTPIWWDYRWLSDGMSTYLSYSIADTILIFRFYYKELRLTDLFVARNVLSMLFLDSHCLTPSKYICTPININIDSHKNISNVYSKDIYTKSGALLRMVSHFLRKDVFQIGLIKYLQKHKYSSVTPDDLWEALQDALDESNVPHDDFKVKEVMDTWFNQSAYPVVKIDRDYNSGKIKATQHKRVHFRSIMETEQNNTWWIPLNYITESNLNSSSTLATHWLTPHNNGIIIEGVNINDWIIVNKQLTGYYRVNYDLTNWQRIAAFLNSDDYDKIPILNRAQIIDDVFYMMETEGLDLRIVLDVLKYLWREIDLLPWYSALRVIQSLAISYLRIPQAATIFKPYFFNLTYKLFERIGFDEQVNDTAVTIEIRLEFTKFACLYNIHPECRQKAIAKLVAYLEDPITNKIAPDKEHLLCYGLLRAKKFIWDHFFEINAKKILTTVKFLGCSANLDIIEKHFNIIKYYYSYTALFAIIYKNLPVNVDAIHIIIMHYEKAATELSSIPLFATAFHNELMNYFREEDIKVIKCLLKNRTLLFKNEYLDDRIKKLNKINENLSNIRTLLKDNPNYYF